MSRSGFSGAAHFVSSPDSCLPDHSGACVSPIFSTKKEIPRFWQRGILTQTNKHKNYLVQFYGGYWLQTNF